MSNKEIHEAAVEAADALATLDKLLLADGDMAMMRTSRALREVRQIAETYRKRMMIDKN